MNVRGSGEQVEHRGREGVGILDHRVVPDAIERDQGGVGPGREEASRHGVHGDRVECTPDDTEG